MTRGKISKVKLSMETPFFMLPPFITRMPSMMSLNTRVHIVSKSGKKETITTRELLARGTGSAFEAFQMLDEYQQLAEAYDAEVAAAAAEEDRENHLPLGSHLLPKDYEDFLYSWNKAIATAPGCRSWNGISRDIYKINNKEAWKQWVAKNKEFRTRYAAEVAQLIAYQASHSTDDSDDEVDELPVLPPSPVTVQELAEQPDTDGEDDEQPWEQPELSEDLCPSCNWRNILGHASCHMCGHTPLSEPQLEPQLIPQVLPAQELAEQPDTDGEDDADAQPQDQEPKRPHNPIYINYKWPSPIAKVFVQHIRGNNRWNNGRNTWWRSDGAWAPDFKIAWRCAGNTEFKLTHDNCMRYLAYRMGSIPLSNLLEMDPFDVHAKLIGVNHGVRGFFIKRYGYYGY